MKEKTPKLKRLSDSIKKLIRVLIENRNHLLLHNQVDQFFYMQKLEELHIMSENIDKATKKLEEAKNRFELEYQRVFCSWKRDARFVSRTTRKAAQTSAD